MILYIQTAFLGDLLLSIPTLKRLRVLFPEKKIHLLCRKGLGTFFIENNIVDEVMDDFVSTKPTVFEIKNRFHGRNYDYLICPHESLRSALISYLIPAKLKIGFTNWYSRLVFHQKFSRPMQYPEALRQMFLLTEIDSETKKNFHDLKQKSLPFSHIPDWSKMNLNFHANRKKFELPEEGQIVCLAPGSVWPTKQWGQERFTKLCDRLIKKGCHVVLVGSASEKELAYSIANKYPQVKNFTARTTLTELAELISVSDVMVCNDSGAMHMASVVGTPTVAIFGPTVQEFGYQPWNTKAVVVENKNLSCRPCSSHGGKTCPIKTHECMTSLSVESIEQKVLAYLI
ncbi:glycosyltransferase family 9 protein [bacterium]|nr:glycosyltransferase family 9 protein [bacterium]